MVVILYPSGQRKTASIVAANLTQAFNDHVKVVLRPAGSSASWAVEVSWDDLLVVMYDAQKFPDSGLRFISKYLAGRPGLGRLLPVALNPSMRRPPGEAGTIKALQYDRTAKGSRGRLVKRVGGMLGLRVLGRDASIFVSYRVSDGASIAKNLKSGKR